MARHSVLPIRRRALPLFRHFEGEWNPALAALPRTAAAVHRQFLDAAPVEKTAGRRVQSLRILPDDDEVDLPRLPHLFEPVVDLVSNVRIEFGGADVRVEVQAESQSKDHTDPGDIAVRQHRLRESDGAE